MNEFEHIFEKYIEYEPIFKYWNYGSCKMNSKRSHRAMYHFGTLQNLTLPNERFWYVTK